MAELLIIDFLSVVIMLSDVKEIVISYLYDQVCAGRNYFKAKHVAQEIGGLTPKQVGTIMGMISKECDRIRVSCWSVSVSNTWRVDLV